MFAVKGWNLTAPLAKQVEQAKPQDGLPGKKSLQRKRKREEKKQTLIDAENLGEYWERVVEGGEEGKKLGEQLAEDPGRHASGVNSQSLGKKRKRKSEKAEGNGEEGGDKVEEKDGKVEAEKEKTVVKAADGDAKTEDTSTTAPLSKRQKKKQKKEQSEQQKLDAQPPSSEKKSKDAKPPAKAVLPQPAAPLIPEPPNLTPLQKSMRAKLISARFRHLNESLYTKPSADSLSIFKENPDMFEDYHRGFAQQVEVWPENPVDGYVDAILSRGKSRVTLDPWHAKHHQKKDKKKNKGGIPEAAQHTPTSTVLTPQKPLPRNVRGQATIADLGCGTASLSYRLQSTLKPLNLTVHSFDLSKPTGPTADLVTTADISALPLADGSVDVAIFCLALMGTNWLDFIDEAWRVLRWRGELWVSEIKSRFGRVSKGGKGKGVPINSIGSLNKKDKKKKGGKKPADEDIKEGPQDSADEAELATHVDGVERGGEGTDVSAFIAVLKSRGFVLDAPVERQGDAIDMGNKMFVKMQFVKNVAPTKGKNVGKEGGDKKGSTRGDVNGYGKAAMRMGITGRKFAVVSQGDDEDAEGGEADGNVLKPCLYKIR